MILNFLFFEGFETLDAFGPVEVLSRIDGAEVHCFSLQGGLINSRQNYAVLTEKLSDIRQEGVLIVPGGLGTRALVHDPVFLLALKELCQSAQYVLSVCTGSALLAAAGVLDHRKATSNRKNFEWVRSVSDKVNWISDARWVVDGKFYTSAGVSAGIDMALGFVRDRFGSDKAAEIAENMEYLFDIQLPVG